MTQDHTNGIKLSSNIQSVLLLCQQSESEWETILAVVMSPSVSLLKTLDFIFRKPPSSHSLAKNVIGFTDLLPLSPKPIYGL